MALKRAEIVGRKIVVRGIQSGDTGSANGKQHNDGNPGMAAEDI
jgi:hypothetical protein